MTKQLTKLTPEQRDRMAPHAQQWIEYGLRTTPLTDDEWEMWETGVRQCYEYAGIRWPGVVVHVSSPIVGAFAAGMVLNSFFDREIEGASLHELLSPLESLVVPLFFVWMGIQVKLETMANKDVLMAGLALTLVAIAGKVAAGWGCPPSMNRLAVGFGMMPLGEVGLIFAGIGKGIGVVDEGLFSAVVLLVMVTTVLAPILLRATMGSDPVAAAPFSARHH